MRTSATQPSDTTTMIESITLEVPDPAAAEAFYTAALGLGSRLAVRASDAATSGFRAFTLEVPDPAIAEAFYTAALGLGSRLAVRASDAATSGFRAFTLSLVVSQPADADAFIDAAIAAGATALKPAKKSLWGYGGTFRAPDGTVWKVATSSKKNTRPASRTVNDFVILLGVNDVAATKRFYVNRGLTVAKSFGSKYVEFQSPAGAVKLALYGRRALAKDAGVSADGSGSHRVVIRSEAGSFADPDGFVWER